MAMLDQVVAKPRKSFQRDIFDFVFEKRRNLMAIKSGVFNDRLDRSGAFTRVWNMAQQFCQSETKSLRVSV